MRSKVRAISCLFRFMLVFEINRFWIFDASEETIKARVGWADDGSVDYDENEEVQDIEWKVQGFQNFDDALEISSFLVDNKLMLNDKIIIDSEGIFNRMGWEKNRCNAAINTLLSVKVDMLDKGKKTDYFFVHF